MAGSRFSKPREDKKRKRDVHDGEEQSKRPKAREQGSKIHRHERTASTSVSTTKNAEPAPVLQHDVTTEEVPVETSLASHDEEDGASWRISKPMGGRMLDVDPILSADEKHLILTYNTSIQVYSTTDSLLVRRIPITSIDASAPKGTTPASIVSTRLSRCDADFLWVGCSDAQVYRVNWRKTEETHQSFKTGSGTLKSLAVTPSSSGKGDVVLVVESDKPHRMDLFAYDVRDISSPPPSKTILTLKKPGSGLQLIEASRDGQVLVGALNDRLFLGTAQKTGDGSFDQTQYDFFSFDVPDLVTALDLRVYSRPAAGRSGKERRVVDVLVGGARGAIYLYHDALARSQDLGKSTSPREVIQAQKYHWHRKAVHALKWSLDGNYMISGGSEQVLVVWQLDTSKKDFLPHLSGSIENIVVSASGSSYILHLDDNSAMIISTAEMKPTTYVSGIQSAAVDVVAPKDSLVQRVSTAPKNVSRPIPAAIRPSQPSKLHVCVGNGRQATMTGALSAPLLQSFDLESFTSVSKQALARTQPTEVNMTNKGNPIDEPLVTHISFSGDGKWLASVDDWVPPARDAEGYCSDIRDQFARDRHEVHLKFWQVQDGEEPLALVSRVNAPHARDSCAEVVLDLVASHRGACFASIGADGMLRLWRPRQDVAWACSQTIAVGSDGLENNLVGADVVAAAVPVYGSVAFSDDGSTLFAAFGAADAGFVHVIDAATGEIVRTLEGLWKGRLQSLRALGQYVVVLSDELRVYDVVSDGLRYGIAIPGVPGVDELLQLAVDAASGHFAVTLPLGASSSVGVFHPEVAEPLMVRSTPHRIVSLVPAAGTSGFVALDDAAQIWVISEGSDASALFAAQPLQDVGLDDVSLGDEDQADEKKGVKEDMMVLLGQGEESDDEMEDRDEDQVEDMDMEEDDGMGVNVIPQQHLADIFDAAPPFAGISVEDMFYKVTSLLASNPLRAAV